MGAAKGDPMRIALSVLALSVLAAPGGPAAPAPADPYAPLALYAGHWRLTTAGEAQTVDLVNHCARTGLFFACEQVVDGKPVALVVFLPTTRGEKGQAYRTQALDADGAAVHPWYDLTIDGDDWTYAHKGEKDGKPLFQRTLNHFTGADHFAFTVQTSPDGAIWTNVTSGQEERVP
jgi:hypothetical protein